MDPRHTWANLVGWEELKDDDDEQPDESQLTLIPPRRRRNAIIPDIFVCQGDDEIDHEEEEEEEEVQPRRNAVALDGNDDGDGDDGIEEEVQLRRNAVAPLVLRHDSDASDEIQVRHTHVDREKDRASTEAATASQSAAPSATEQQKPSKQKAQAPRTDKPASEIHYVRAGRRTVEDDNGDIPTQFIVVAKIDMTKSKSTWLSIATWQLNGLRIGTVSSGDRIQDNDEVLGYSIGLNADPFFVARNAASPGAVREILLGRLGRGEVAVQAETLDDDAAQRERIQAQESRMLKEYGSAVMYGGAKAVRRVAAMQDAKLRFPHPWALPVALTRSTSRFPARLGGFSSVANDVTITSINVVATFANEIDGGRDLRLKHFMQVAFEPDETLDSAKRYFLKGDESAEFRGLEDNRFLSKKWWLLELWVLPQFQGCSVLYRWDDAPELTARAFCDAKALSEGGEDVEPKLYVEVRIVQDPNHLGGVSEEDVSSSEDEP
jgi:hypothetical protein